MATTDIAPGPAAEPDRVRAEWVGRVTDLVTRVEAWARELDWSTRRVDKTLKESDLGTYSVPGLVMQKEFTRVLLDPIARRVPGAEGVVDLYLMPGLDDIASLFFTRGDWHIHYSVPAPQPTGGVWDEVEWPLSKETLGKVFDEMTGREQQ